MRTIFAILGAFVIFFSFVGWKVYDHNKTEAKEEAALAKKTFRASDVFNDADIFKGADFNAQETKVVVLKLTPEPYSTTVEDEEQKKRIIKELSQLTLRKSKHFYDYEKATRFLIEMPEKSYSIYVFEEERNFFFDATLDYSFDVENGESFFNLLNELTKREPISNSK